MPPNANEPNASRGLRVVGLASPVTGTGANDTVLRWSGANVVEGNYLLSQWCERTNDVNAGTSFRMLMRGRYVVKLAIEAQDGFVVPGITVDAVGTELSDTPSWSMAHLEARAMLANDPEVSQVFATEVVAEFFVTQAMVNAGLGIVRAHAGNGSGGIDDAQVNRTECAIIIRRTGDCPD